MRLLPFEYAVRNLGRAPRRTVGTIFGSALVVTLLLAATSFIWGMQRSLKISGRADNVILILAGSEESLERSQLNATAAGQVVASISGLASRLGVPYVSPEVHIAMLVKRERDSGEPMLANLRGVTPSAFLVHEQVRIVEGKAPIAGQNELMVGTLASTRMGVPDDVVAVGRSLWFDDRSWKITGRFAAPETVMDAEIWVPLTDLQIATKRDNVSCIVLTLGDAEFADVDAFCKQRLDLELVAIHEADYYGRLLDFFAPIRAVVLATGLLIAGGGLLGGLNTLYAAFSARIRELAALQTLGFSRRAIVISLLEESLLITSMGSLIACVFALTCLDGVAVRFSMGAFGLRVDAPVLAIGLASGLLLGILGALPPAYRCLRPAIPEALRAA